MVKRKTEWNKVTKRSVLIALSICFMVVLTGCGSDDGSDGGSDSGNDLAGTTWTEDGNPMSTLTFSADGTTFRAVDPSDGTDATGTCTPTGPNTYSMSLSWYEGSDLITVTGSASVSDGHMTVNGSVYVNGNLVETFSENFTKQDDVNPPPNGSPVAGTSWDLSSYGEELGILAFVAENNGLECVLSIEHEMIWGSYTYAGETFTAKFSDIDASITITGTRSGNSISGTIKLTVGSDTQSLPYTGSIR